MTLKKRFYITAIILTGLIIFRILFNDVQSEIPIFINILLGMVVFNLIAFYLLKTDNLKTISGNNNIMITSGIALLIIGGLYWVSKIDTQQENFWVVNGDVWLNEVLGVILVLLFLYIIYSWSFKQWKKIQILKNEKSQTELTLLKNQINPHFFFNTLNNLYSLIKKDPNIAQEYVLKLSDMMRFTIYDSKKETVILEDEINFLTNFIALQTGRYHKEIDVQFKQNIINLKTSIPPLLFIILVENAFKHGVEKLLDKVFIHIELIENTTELIFSIKNNFDENEQLKKEGIGLQNLKSRLNLLYPNAHKLTISSQNNIYSVKLILDKIYNSR